MTLFQRVDELEDRVERLIDIVAQINQALFAVERTTEGQTQLNSTFAEAILGLRADLGHVASDLDGLDMKVDDLDEDIEDIAVGSNRRDDALAADLDLLKCKHSPWGAIQ